MAPEYVKHGKFSLKSDVYSFGVLILEIISGEKISHFRNNGVDLLTYVSEKHHTIVFSLCFSKKENNVALPLVDTYVAADS